MAIYYITAVTRARGWFLGNVVCLLSLVFLRGFRDAQSERRLSICLKSLSLTSSTFVRAFRSRGNLHISDFVAASLVLCCVRVLCFSFYVSVFALLSPPRILCTVGDRTWHPI